MKLAALHATYLLGTSESRRLFELSMKQGFVDTYTDKMLFYGSAGVGKTCTMSIVAGEDPPNVRNSTPLATRPIIMYQMQEMEGKWHKYRSKDRMRLCARVSKTTSGRELVKTIIVKSGPVIEVATEQNPIIDGDSEPRTASKSSEEHPETNTTQQNLELVTPPSTAASLGSVDPDVLKVIHDVLEEMFQFIDECPETEEPLSYIHKLLISDCGGQPQFHEVLPIFLRKMSMIVFVFKLSEDLSSRPMIEYYEDDKALGTPYELDLTTEQLIQQGLQSLHSRWSNSNRAGEPPQIVMIGTHKDLEKQCQESRETKNRKLCDMLLPTFKKEIIYYQERTNDIFFPMNAKSPGKEEEAGAGKIRSAVSRRRQSNLRQLPLQWLGLEIILGEITQQLQRGILSMNECLEVARGLHLDESALEAALIYLDELSLIFYYPDILPDVVFTNPQVLLDKLSELVKVHHDIIKRSPDHADTCSGAWQEFFNHALITIEFLTQEIFKEHYVPRLFQPEHLMILYRKLFIFADHSEGKYFVPCLLRMLDKRELAMKRLSIESLVAPLVLKFPDDLPHRGVFCAVVSFLTSPENHFPGPWKLKMPARSVTPTCLYRNCIQFTVPGFKTACTITLIDTLLHFEVHFNLKSPRAASRFCPIVKQAISAGLTKANIVLGYSDSTPTFALICPCGEGEPHPATIGDESWICSLDEGVGDELAPNQLLWLEELEKPTPEPSAGMLYTILNMP